jgi:hypothetical protein
VRSPRARRARERRSERWCGSVSSSRIAQTLSLWEGEAGRSVSQPLGEGAASERWRRRAIRRASVPVLSRDGADMEGKKRGVGNTRDGWAVSGQAYSCISQWVSLETTRRPHRPGLP